MCCRPTTTGGWWKQLLRGILHSNGLLAWRSFFPTGLCCINATDLMKCILGADDCYFHANSCLQQRSDVKLAVFPKPWSQHPWAPHSDSSVADGSKAQHNQLSDQRLSQGRARSVEIGTARSASEKNRFNKFHIGSLKWSQTLSKRLKTLRYSWIFMWCTITSFVPTISSRVQPLQGSSTQLDPGSYLKTSQKYTRITGLSDLFRSTLFEHTYNILNYMCIYIYINVFVHLSIYHLYPPTPLSQGERAKEAVLWIFRSHAVRPALALLHLPVGWSCHTAIFLSRFRGCL